METVTKNKTQAAAEWTLIGLFLAALAIPLPAALYGREGRMGLLASKLVVETKAGRYYAVPGIFRKHFEDNFGFRRALIFGHGILKVKALRVSSTPRVVLGKDGWLYLDENGSIDYYRNVFPFALREVETWRHTLEGRRDWLAARGIAYIVVVAPNKDTIYPEYVPDTLNKVNHFSRFDQLLNYLKYNSDFVIVDLRPALAAHARHEQVYYKTDTHWNDIGAFVVYRKIMKAVAAYFPEVRVRTREDFRTRTRVMTAGDLTNLMGIKGALREEDPRLVPRRPGCTLSQQRSHSGNLEILTTRCDTGEIPRAIILNDSFMNNLYPFLAPHFGTALFLWEDGFVFFPEIYEKFRPNVVIQEMVERRL